MTLTVISNFAANVSHRNLMQTDMETTRSIAQLSSGKRVQSARDDAASLAIGSRLRAEVAALQAARVNAGQASSMLQIADGAMSQIDNILVRMKTLSIQSGSSQFGSVERNLIDAEFQQLLLEIDRIAQDTEFNGANLLDGGDLTRLVKTSDPGLDGVSQIKLDSSVEDNAVFQYSYNATGEILTVTKLGVNGVIKNTANELFDRNTLSLAFDSTVASDAVFSYSFDQTTDSLSLTNNTTNETATLDLTKQIEKTLGAGAAAGTVGPGQTLTVDFASLGVEVTFTEGFNFASSIAGTTLNVDNNVLDTANNATATVTFDTGLSAAAVTKLNSILAAQTTPGLLELGTSDSTNTNNITLDAAANIAYALDGGAIGAINAATGDIAANASHSIDLYLDSDGDGTAETRFARVNLSDTVDTDSAGNMDIDFRQIVSNTQTVKAVEDQAVQVDLTEKLDAIAGTGLNLSGEQTLDVDIEQFGVALEFDNGFDRTNSRSTTIGSVDTTSLPSGATIASNGFTANNKFYSADVYQALLDLGFDSTTGIGFDANSGTLHLGLSEDASNNVTLAGLTGLTYGFGDGKPTGDLAATDPDVKIGIKLADGSTVNLGTLAGSYVASGTAQSLGTIDLRLGRGVFFNKLEENSAQSDFTFKIGTGNQASDNIVLSFDSVNADALGLRGIGVTTKETSDTASKAISSAVTNLNRARANIGALQNRLGVASSNLSVSIENTEAARSQLLDLDVAKGITEFTSKQILLQAGVSTLSRANQLPQNLLQLFQ